MICQCKAGNNWALEAGAVWSVGHLGIARVMANWMPCQTGSELHAFGTPTMLEGRLPFVPFRQQALQSFSLRESREKGSSAGVKRLGKGLYQQEAYSNREQKVKQLCLLVTTLPLTCCVT